MRASAQQYFNQGISAATRKAYTTGLKKYSTFCSQTKLQPVPATEDTLILFVTHLAQQNLSYGTIQVYLSAVRYYHIANQEYSISTTSTTPRMTQVLKGIRKSQALVQTRRDRQPITFPIMQRLQSVFVKYPSTYFNTMIWAACCLAYFGLLRVSEFTTQSPDYINHSRDLLLADVALDSHTSPQMVRLTIKQSKTDQFRQGTYVYLGKTDHRVCPVMVLVQYLAKRGGKPGPLFMLPNNKALTRENFCAALNKAFQELEMSPCTFNTHSFRIGAATSAKQAGISDSLLKTLGRWRSNAYQKYIKPSPQDLAKLSKTLTTGTH